MVNKTILSLAIASALAVSGCATRINMDKLSGDMLAQHAAGSPKMETSRGDDSLINSSNSLDDFLTDGYNKKFHAIRVADDDSQEVCKCNAEKGLNEGIQVTVDNCYGLDEQVSLIGYNPIVEGSNIFMDSDLDDMIRYNEKRDEEWAEKHQGKSGLFGVMNYIRTTDLDGVSLRPSDIGGMLTNNLFTAYKTLKDGLLFVTDESNVIPKTAAGNSLEQISYDDAYSMGKKLANGPNTGVQALVSYSGLLGGMFFSPEESLSVGCNSDRDTVYLVVNPQAIKEGGGGSGGSGSSGGGGNSGGSGQTR